MVEGLGLASIQVREGGMNTHLTEQERAAIDRAIDRLESHISHHEQLIPVHREYGDHSLADGAAQLIVEYRADVDSLAGLLKRSS